MIFNKITNVTIQIFKNESNSLFFFYQTGKTFVLVDALLNNSIDIFATTPSPLMNHDVFTHDTHTHIVLSAVHNKYAMG